MTLSVFNPRKIEIKRSHAVLKAPFVETGSTRTVACCFPIKAERVSKQVADPRSETIRFASYASHVKRSAGFRGIALPSALCDQICTASLRRPSGIRKGRFLQKLLDLKWAYPAFFFFKQFPTPS
jgi:hypothetical protein